MANCESCGRPREADAAGCRLCAAPVSGRVPEGTREARAVVLPLEGIAPVLGSHRPMIGRRFELERLQDLFEACRGQNRLTALEIAGGTGVGKTRLLLEFRRWLAGRFGTVFLLEAGGLPSMALEPYGLLRRAFHDGLDLPEAPNLVDAARILLEVTPKLAGRRERESERSDFRDWRPSARHRPEDIDDLLVLTRLLGVAAAERESIPLDGGAAGTLRSRGVLALKRQLAAWSTEAPVVFLFDDVHDADSSSLEMLAAACGDLAARPIYLLSTTEVAMVDLPAPWRKMTGRVLPLVLHPLRPKDDVRLAESLLQDVVGLPVRICSTIAAVTGGNPGLTEEVVRSLRDRGALVGEGGQWRFRELSEPEQLAVFELDSALRMRFEKLSASEFWCLGLVALWGEGFLASMLPNLSKGQEEEEELRPALESLEAKELLVMGARPSIPSGEAWHWVHPETIELFGRGLESSESRRLHRLLAKQMEDRRERFPGRWLAALARRRELAGEVVEASRAWLRGARRARALAAPAEAEGMYRASLRGKGDPRKVPEARYELARHLLRHGARRAEAIDQLRLAHGAAREGGNVGLEIDCLELMGQLLLERGAFGQSRPLFEKALRLHGRRRGDGSSQPAAIKLECRLLVALGEIERISGALGRSVELLERALELADQGGSREILGQILRQLGQAEDERGNPETAFLIYDRALELHRETRDPIGEGRTLLQLANLEREQGLLEEARQTCIEALGLFRRLKERSAEGRAEGCLGCLEAVRGNSKEAEAHLKSALVLHRQTGDRRAEAWHSCCLAMLNIDVGKLEEARLLLGHALMFCRQLRDESLEASIQICAGRFWRLTGESFQGAGRLLREAAGYLRARGIWRSLVLALCELGHLELVKGVSGEEWLEEARNFSSRLGVRPNGRVAQAVGRLERAQFAFDSGAKEQLFRGEGPEDQRRWLRELRKVSEGETGSSSVADSEALTQAKGISRNFRLREVFRETPEGGFYRCARSKDESDVIVRTIRREPRRTIQAFRCQVRALARLRHPSMARILDWGLQGDYYWLSLTLVRGESLLEAARKLWDPTRPVSGFPEGWSATIEFLRTVTTDERALRAFPKPAIPAEALHSIFSLFRRLCGILIGLHGEGLVHGSLHPGAIAVLPDGSLKIADCGSVVPFGLPGWQGTLSQPVSDAQAIPYLSPEQMRGQPYDARADLYAVGAMLYQVLTGRQPFGSSPERLKERPRAEKPFVQPSMLLDGIPADVDDLMVRLLAGSPQRRLGSASSLANVLLKLGSASEPLDCAAPPRPYLYRPGFAGRRELLSQLVVRLETLRPGDLVLLWLRGARGVGKTTLLREMARLARLKGATVVSGECVDSGGRTLEICRKTFRYLINYCREQGPEETRRLLGDKVRILASYEPALDELPGLEKLPDPEDLPAEPAQNRLFATITSLLTDLAKQGVLVLTIDNLQWADEMSLGFLDYLTRSRPTGGSSILLLGTCQSQIQKPQPALESLLRNPRAERIDLDLLQEDDVSDIVGDMLAVQPPPANFSRFLHRHSKGNPFFVAEYVLSAVEHGLLWQDEEGIWHAVGPDGESATLDNYRELPLPTDIRELARERLQRLPRAQKLVVDAVAVLGGEPSLLLLEGVTVLGEAELFDAISKLFCSQILEPVGGGAVRFVHDTVKEVARESIDKRRRRLLHEAAAKEIERLYSDDLDSRLAILGQHWELAEAAANARACYLSAARQAVEHSAHTEAERLYRAYLALAEGPGRERTEALMELARRVLAFRGRWEEARELLLEAIEDARRSEDLALEARGLSWLGNLYLQTGAVESAREQLEQALNIQQGLDNALDQAFTLSQLARLHKDGGLLVAARVIYQKALSLQQSAGDQQEEISTLMALAGLHSDQGRLREAHRLYEQGLLIQRKVGNRRGEATTLNNLATVYEKRGDLEEACRLTERSLAIARELGDRRHEGVALNNLAFYRYLQGRLQEAGDHYGQALVIHREVDNLWLQGLTLSNLATLLVDQGRPEDAVTFFESALEIHRELQNKRFEARTLWEMARMSRLVHGRFQEARRHLDDSLSILRKLGGRIYVATALSEAGGLSLATGGNGVAELEEAREMIRGTAVGPRSEIARAMEILEAAIQAKKQGGKLFRGQRVEDIPQGLRAWLQLSDEGMAH